jgi:ferritin-like metal-binding protein YciE
MAVASLKDLYFEELGDLYDAETQMLHALPRYAEAAHAPELREALMKHYEESRLYLERLQLIFTHWGERPGLHRCLGVEGIVQEADDRLNRAASDDALDAAIIGAAQRIDHYELAAYGCARTYARRLNRPDEARLLQETLDEERRADHRLNEIAESHVVDDARTEVDIFESEQAHRLRYESAERLSGGRAPAAELAIRNDADEELGAFDGLLFDRVRARYIVVRAHRLFGGRRYVLPLTLVRYDEPNRVLRVSLDKAIAERYPAFDSEAFDAMDAPAHKRFAAELRSFFPRAEKAGPSASAEDRLPSWLVAGVWPQTAIDRAAINEQTRDVSR